MSKTPSKGTTGSLVEEHFSQCLFQSLDELKVFGCGTREFEAVIRVRTNTENELRHAVDEPALAAGQDGMKQSPRMEEGDGTRDAVDLERA